MAVFLNRIEPAALMSLKNAIREGSPLLDGDAAETLECLKTLWLECQAECSVSVILMKHGVRVVDGVEVYACDISGSLAAKELEKAYDRARALFDILTFRLFARRVSSW